MQNPKGLKELLAGGGHRLGSIQRRSAARSRVLEAVRAALPPRLGEELISAGLEEGILSIGVSGAVWASRVRYLGDTLKPTLAKNLKQSITQMRVRVVPKP